MNNKCGCDSNNHKHEEDCGCSHEKNNCGCSQEIKNEGCNDFDSVPVTYDSAESCHKHEKCEGNNQWCSTHR